MEVNNPYLTIINNKNRYNPHDFKGMQFKKIDVKMGDWFKKTGLIESETLEALNNAKIQLRGVGATCTVNSAGRTQFDQVYAKVEKFAGVLKNKSRTIMVVPSGHPVSSYVTSFPPSII